MQLHRPFLPASRFVLALTAATSRDYQYFRQIQQARSRAYRTVHSTELDKISFPRTQLVLRYSSPVPPTKSLRNSIDSTFARATSDRRIYFRTRNKQIVPEMAAGEKGDAYDEVFNSNTKWRGSMAEKDPALFERLSKGQSPEILWIGCADSRCPETTILGLNPGDVFVHRNIANILIPTDLNSLSVIQYAVEYLKVKHIVICGHTSCGGIAAALDNKKLGLIDTWLMPLRQLRRENLKLLESMGEKERGLKLVELNVRHGVDVLTDNSVVLDAIKERGLKVHGLIYDVGTGELKELDINESEEKINSRTTAFKTD